MNLSYKKHAGAAMIEFALSFSIFWACLLGFIEFSRLMFAYSAANEATRLAARLASICSTSDVENIKTKVRRYIEASGLIDISSNSTWLDLSEVSDSSGMIIMVRAKLSNVKVKWDASIIGVIDSDLTPVTQISLPEFKTTVLRESMTTTINGEANSICN